MPTLVRIDSPGMMEIHVTGPRRANRLFIFTGIARFSWIHESRDRWEGWVTENLRVSMLPYSGVPRLYEDQVIGHNGTAALSTFSMSETTRSDTWGVGIESVDSFFTADPDHELDFTDFGLNIGLSLRGYEIRLFGVTFQQTILARL